MAYVGGPGGTGKSQIIKMIVRLHDELEIRHKLVFVLLWVLQQTILVVPR